MATLITSNRPGSRPRLQVPITYLDDVILATNKEAWTWVRLPEFSGGLPNANAVRDHVVRHSAGLAKLVAGREDVRGHLRVTNIPTSPDQWASNVVDRAASYGHPDAMRTFMDHQVAYQLGSGHVDTRVHLGISLGNLRRETLTTTGPFKWFRNGTRALESAAGVDGEILTQDDLANRHARAHAVRATLRSSMGSVGATRRDIEDLILNSTNPGMRPPRLHLPARRFGPGLQEILFNDPIRVHNRMIAYLDADDRPIMWAAHLCLARTEPEFFVGDSDPWLYAASQVGFPVDWSVRFRLRPTTAVKADLRAKGAHARDMHNHIREAGKSPSIELTEAVEQLAQYEHEVSKGKQPGLYAQYVARVCDPDPSLLSAKVQALRESMHDQGMEMQWSTGDQLAYLMAEVPGGPDHHRPYEQHTNLLFLFGGGPTWSNAVGDQVDQARSKGHLGASIGETNTATPRSVPFDAFVALVRNAAPGFLLTGSSGSGKSYLFQLIALIQAMQGVTVTFLDPKGDVVDPLGRTFRLPDLIEAVTGRRPAIIDTYQSPPGILEPFRLGMDPADGVQLAMQVVESLLGGQRSDASQAALASAVNAEADTLDPTLTGVLDRLGVAGKDGNDAARALFERLRVYRRMKYSRLLFGEPGQQSEPIGEQGRVTFLLTHGLQLPSENTPADEHDVGQRLSSVILSLLCRRATAGLLNTDPDHPKALFVDEAHAVMSTRAGRKMILDCIKMLRSKRGVVGLASQELSDTFTGGADSTDKDNAVTNNISTYFGFRCKSDPEAGRVLGVLDPALDSQDTELRRMIRTQPTGQCFMRDMDNRVEQITTAFYLDSLRLAFETNAEDRARITLEQIREALDREFGVSWTPLADRADRPDRVTAEVLQ